MLAFESSSHEQPYFQQLSMDGRMHSNHQLVDGFNPFEAYSTFPSDPFPFIVHPVSSSFMLEQDTLKTTGPQELHHPSASPPLQALSSSSSSSSSHSLQSGPPSSIGSPHQDAWPDMDPAVTGSMDDYSHAYATASIDPETLFADVKLPEGFVDPALIEQPIQDHSNYPPPTGYSTQPQYFPASPLFANPSQHLYSPQLMASQQPQHIPQAHQQQQQAIPLIRHESQDQHQAQQQPAQSPHLSPFLHHRPELSGQQLDVAGRRSSISSIHSKHSAQNGHSGVAVEQDDESRESHRCPHPDCGRTFRDLRAHMLTHQSERPEKCPIVTCEYHFKGFARKYDKNRHTLTHYKGTMVCGFCPGSGSAAEKSFNRADVFKRHLTSVHGVDQSAPNCRKKSPSATANKLSNYCQDATGKCSTCGSTFNNAQDFYEHLDDCVLRVVQQEEPSEAINLKRLNEVSSDKAVLETMERHNLMDTTTETVDDQTNTKTTDGGASSKSKSGTISKSGIVGGAGVTKRPTICRRRNNRNNYPPAWGCPTSKMKMKRRLLCLYDGPRRLWKDEMMLDNEFEVRLKLPGGDGNGREAYITDLDVETLRRAQGVLNATAEEKGPWIPTTTQGAHGLLGPAAVPIIGRPDTTGEELYLEELNA